MLIQSFFDSQRFLASPRFSDIVCGVGYMDFNEGNPSNDYSIIPAKDCEVWTPSNPDLAMKWITRRTETSEVSTDWTARAHLVRHAGVAEVREVGDLEHRLRVRVQLDVLLSQQHCQHPGVVVPAAGAKPCDFMVLYVMHGDKRSVSGKVPCSLCVCLYFIPLWSSSETLPS